ncbi:NAD-dependent epimerase/dehydratase family protein [Kitasatospora sp. NPDC028055]|uniref:NAD-dependent epimerase/dehydratase family protein n=1 Tax=Kitasatospora sp. NPDC028055 TaxID=3155653 RepID=UPI003408B597
MIAPSVQAPSLGSESQDKDTAAEESLLRRLSGLRGARVAVTGGGGLVGSRVVALARRAGASVAVLDRFDAYPEDVRELFGLDRFGAELAVGDICDRDTVRRVVKGADYVIHAAAYADVAACARHPDVAFEANVRGTEIVLEEIAAAPVRRLVFISSAAVYGNGRPGVTGPQVFQEDQLLVPVSVYANTKLWAEHQARLMLGGPGRAEVTVLRYFSVYGDPQIPKPGSHSWMVAWMSMHAHLGLPIHLNGGGVQVRDLVHVEDIAAATVLALVEERAAGQVINIGTGTPTSVREVANLIAPHYPGSRQIVTPLPEGDPLGGYASIERMRECLVRAVHPGARVGGDRRP